MLPMDPAARIALHQQPSLPLVRIGLDRKHKYYIRRTIRSKRDDSSWLIASNSLAQHDRLSGVAGGRLRHLACKADCISQIALAGTASIGRTVILQLEWKKHGAIVGCPS
jgi:hypothetical protein